MCGRSCSETHCAKAVAPCVYKWRAVAPLLFVLPRIATAHSDQRAPFSGLCRCIPHQSFSRAPHLRGGGLGRQGKEAADANNTRGRQPCRTSKQGGEVRGVVVGGRPAKPAAIFISPHESRDARTHTLIIKKFKCFVRRTDDETILISSYDVTYITVRYDVVSKRQKSKHVLHLYICMKTGAVRWASAGATVRLAYCLIACVIAVHVLLWHHQRGQQRRRADP